MDNTDYKQYRKMYITFISYYNKNKPFLSSDCINAINNLHNIWECVSIKSDKNIFFLMKEHERIINIELQKKQKHKQSISTTTNISLIDYWKNYYYSGYKFRIHMLNESS
jgi:hypothetical protein